MMNLGRQILNTGLSVRHCRFVIISRLFLVLIFPLFLLAFTGQVYGAPDTLDLQLDDPAVIRWYISNIKPGDTGTEPVNLRNGGDIPGYLYIWISDTVDGEGLNPESETGNTAEPGELSSYLYLDIVNPGMIFGQLTASGGTQNVNLPLRLDNFPDNSNQALFVSDTAIGVGETLVLEWQWQLPAAAGNEVQGDNVSFTINYMLSSPDTDEENTEPTEPPVHTTPVTTTPPTNLSTPTLTTEPTTVPTGTDVPDDDTSANYTNDNTPVPTETTTTPAITVIEEPPANGGILAPASLGVMISGTFAMSVLAGINRWQRHLRMKLDN